MKNQSTLPPFFRIILSAMACLVIAPSSASAASYDCAKAAAQVEKTICSESKLSILDDEMSFVYKYALFSTKNSVTLKKSQRDWIKKRNLCQDKICLNKSYQNRIDEFEAIVDGHQNKPLNPEDALKGLWYGSDRAAHAIYGTILITDNTIAWGGKPTSNPYCKTEYSIEKEPFGVSFKNQTKFTYVFNENSQFKTYKLKLVPRECLNKLTYLRFTLPFDIPNYADVIEYEENDHISGYIHFQKK